MDAGTQQLEHTPTCCKQPPKLHGSNQGCSSHEGTHTHQCCGGDATRAVHHEGTQPRAEQGIQACCSHGAGQEAPGRVVTAVSPTSGHGRRHWGDTGAHGHMRTRHGQKAASVAVASHLPEVALAPATTAAAGSLTVSAPPLTVA